MEWKSTTADSQVNAISFIALPHKPNAQIAYRFIQCPNLQSPAVEREHSILIVFINGLMLPMSSWDAAITHLLKSAQNEASNLTPLALLSYDRYGQGQTTDRDPTDAPSDPSHGHDILSSVTDLHHLLTAVTASRFPADAPPRLLFVAHSIGCPLARLYCAAYPRTVSALLLLDSNIANSDILSIFPDPASPDFAPSEDFTVDELLALRQRISQTFHPDVGSPEGLSRRNLPRLLPHASLPKLLGPNSRGPFITVVSHGSVAFAEEGWRQNATPRPLSDLLSAAWAQYNEGLCELTDTGQSRGPIEAVGSGHFVQRDRPDLVATETLALLWKMRDERAPKLVYETNVLA